MATFVLVHPAWMGAWCWHKIVVRLRKRGHDVFVPTLTGLAERAHLASPAVGLAVHVEDVVSLVEFEDLHDVVLVGNSSGGTVITGAAERMAQRISTLVYIDAFLPSNGQSTFDLLAPERRRSFELLVKVEGDGWLVPRFAPPLWPIIIRDIWQVTDEADARWMLSRLRPTPIRHFTEPVQLSTGHNDGMARAYVRCTGSPMPAPPFDTAAALARATPGWRYAELDAPHIAHITHPDELTTLLTELALAPSPHPRTAE